VEADAADNPVALDLGKLRVDLSGGDQHRYRHFDFRRNVKMVSNAQGVVEAAYFYAPWGETQIYGSSAENRRFAQGLEAGGVGPELALLLPWLRTRRGRGPWGARATAGQP